MFSLSKTKFEQKIKSGEDFIIYKKVKNFNNDPHKSFINVVEKNKYSFIYESVEGGINRGRYTICGFDPLIILKINNKKANLYKKKKNKLNQVKHNNTDPFKSLENLISNLKIRIDNSLPPMSSGVFGYLGYEAINYIEKISRNKKKDILNLPDCLLFYPKNLFIYDNHEKELFIIKAFIKGTYNKNLDNYFNIKKNIISDLNFINDYNEIKLDFD